MKCIEASKQDWTYL